MPTLGEELKRKREERGISLAEISESTRIGTRFLKAIETDNFSTLPGGIFTRSFIRAYAKQVGMDEDDAIAAYQRQVGVQTGEHVEELRPEPRPVPAPMPEPKVRRYEPVAFRTTSTRTNWATLVIGAGIVLFVIVLVLGVVRQLNRASDEASAPAASTQRTEATRSASAENPSTPETTPPPAAPSYVEPLVVKIEAADGDAWIRYQVDDDKPTTLVLKQGETTDIPPAQTQVTLNYGNRMGLRIKINNRDANFPADTPKFASTVIISRDNLATYLQ